MNKALLGRFSNHLYCITEIPTKTLKNRTTIFEYCEGVETRLEVGIVWL